VLNSFIATETKLLMSEKTVPATNVLFLSFMYTVFDICYRLYFRMRIKRDRRRLNALAAQGRPLIVVFNHASYLDVPAVGVSLGLKLMRQMTLPGKKELFEDVKTRWLVDNISVIPVDREMADLTAVRRLLRALQQGRYILISPEGTRSPDGSVRPFQVGFAKLAHKANALVVPVGIQGAARALPRGTHFPRPRRLIISIGEPLDPQNYLPGKPDHADFEAFAEVTRQAVVQLCSGSDRRRSATP
jgi:1-acyl-sn-glycerol-3-phosphate acyltransferase